MKRLISSRVSGRFCLLLVFFDLVYIDKRIRPDDFVFLSKRHHTPERDQNVLLGLAAALQLDNKHLDVGAGKPCNFHPVDKPIGSTFNL